MSLPSSHLNYAGDTTTPFVDQGNQSCCLPGVLGERDPALVAKLRRVKPITRLSVLASFPKRY